LNPAGFAAAVADRLRTKPSEKDRAVTVARVILRAPNIDKTSDIALLARQLLTALGLKV